MDSADKPWNVGGRAMIEYTQQYFLDPKMTWGELSVLQNPGLYWTNINRIQDADRFCSKIIAALPSDGRAALILCALEQNIINPDSMDYSIRKLPVFSLPEKKSAAFALCSDLECSLFTQERLYILMAQSTFWEKFTDKELEIWLKKLSHWLQRENSTFIIINQGPGIENLEARLNGNNRYINGLTRLQWKQDISLYYVSWWHGEHGIIANKKLQMLNDKEQWLIQQNIEFETAMSALQDSKQFLAEVTVLEGKKVQSKDWKLFESNQKLAMAANDARAATVIFSLYKPSEVETLAKLVHSLRRNCGKYLKIVVRAMSNSIRTYDEILLNICGANLCVPYAVTLSKFLNLVRTMQFQQFTGHVPANLDELLLSIHPIKKKGYVVPELFIKEILERANTTILPENGKGILVVLTPENTISAQQTLYICDLPRFGDIVTVIANHVYLFLSVADIVDLDKILNGAFRIPVKELFVDMKIFEKDTEIIKVLRNATWTNSDLVNEQKLAQLMDKTVEQEPHKVMQKTRRTPVRINLSANKKQDK